LRAPGGSPLSRVPLRRRSRRGLTGTRGPWAGAGEPGCGAWRGGVVARPWEARRFGFSPGDRMLMGLQLGGAGGVGAGGGELLRGRCWRCALWFVLSPVGRRRISGYQSDGMPLEAGLALFVVWRGGGRGGGGVEQSKCGRRNLLPLWEWSGFISVGVVKPRECNETAQPDGDEYLTRTGRRRRGLVVPASNPPNWFHPRRGRSPVWRSWCWCVAGAVLGDRRGLVCSGW